jgi:hypothetical protein
MGLERVSLGLTEPSNGAAARAAEPRHEPAEVTATMEDLLLELLGRLERLGAAHGELYDSEVREQMGDAVMEGYVRRRSGHRLPDRFGMLSEAADAEVRAALAAYIEGANALAEEIGLSSFHARLAAFQDPAVRTDPAIAVDDDDLFGHTPPDWYDEGGNVLWDRVR